MKTAQVGRGRAANCFTARPGVAPVVRNAITSCYSAWKHFIDETMLRKIHRCTNIEGQREDPHFEITLEELEAFICIQYARGVYGKSHTLDFLWHKSFGPPIFHSTMGRQRCKQIYRYLRFDEKSTRSQRLDHDKFTHVREILDRFAENCQTSYVPNFELTIDEQLMPLKSRCPFIVFMPNKPDKFGLKFWILAEVESRYVVNIIPYLGKQERLMRGDMSLSQSVVMRLTDPVKNKGYNICHDNFFSTLENAKLLQQRKCSVVGTIKKSAKGIPKEIKEVRRNEKYSSQFYWENDIGCLLVNYQCKEKKNVCLISTMHDAPRVDNTNEKKKPHVIMFYNRNKVGVDAIDQMARLYSTHSATRRWPLAVWTNILDLAAINAWTVYKKVTGRTISRKRFILQLCEDLRKHHVSSKITAVQSIASPTTASRKRRKCRGRNCKNATVTICRSCEKPTCGKCCAKEDRVIHVICKDCV